MKGNCISIDESKDSERFRVLDKVRIGVMDWYLVRNTKTQKIMTIKPTEIIRIW